MPCSLSALIARVAADTRLHSPSLEQLEAELGIGIVDLVKAFLERSRGTAIKGKAELLGAVDETVLSNVSWNHSSLQLSIPFCGR